MCYEKKCYNYYYLKLLVIYVEPVEVDDAACLLRGEVKEHETLAAEVGHVVVHLEGVADNLPVLTIEAVEERCLIGSIVEVMINT